MTAPHPSHPQYEIEFAVGDSRVTVTKDDARSAVDALRECARLHGVAVLSPVGGKPILVDREPKGGV